MRGAGVRLAQAVSDRRTYEWIGRFGTLLALFALATYLRLHFLIVPGGVRGLVGFGVWVITSVTIEGDG